jgi:hypothetical protein
VIQDAHSVMCTNNRNNYRLPIVLFILVIRYIRIECNCFDMLLLSSCVLCTTVCVSKYFNLEILKVVGERVQMKSHSSLFCSVACVYTKRNFCVCVFNKVFVFLCISAFKPFFRAKQNFLKFFG